MYVQFVCARARVCRGSREWVCGFTVASASGDTCTCLVYSKDFKKIRVTAFEM